MAKKKVPTSKGYDPYNKPTASKPKAKPNRYPASPNNPYNNAGPKVKATSRGPTSYGEVFDRPVKGNNARKALTRSADRAFMQNSDKSFVPKAREAAAGMARKNAAKKAAVDSARKARPSKLGWANASGAKAGGVKGQGIQSRPGGGMVKWGTAGAKRAPSATLGGYAKGAAKVAGGALSRLNAAATAGAVGYAAGTALNKKFNISGRIVDAIAPKYNPNASGRQATMYKGGMYKNAALQKHEAAKRSRKKK